jgi:multiple antibiotic resistance protein
VTGFGSAFFELLAIVDPIGTAAIFASLSRCEDASSRAARAIALRATAIATVVLVSVAWLGAALVRAEWLDVDALRVAGGLLLFSLAWRMLQGQGLPARHGADIALFPLAVPLLAGPGCISTVIVLSARHANVAVTAAVLSVQCIAFGCLWIAPRVVGALGASGVRLVSLLAGLLLAMLAIRHVIGGSAAIWRGQIASSVGAR